MGRSRRLSALRAAAVLGAATAGTTGAWRLAPAVAHRVCPALLRRLVATGLGVAVTAGVAPAMATGSGDDGGLLTGLRVPDRVNGRTQPLERTVEVRAGQSLWSITAGLLPADATDARVTATWHRLYRANVARVGPDPDLVHPGTRLAVPDLSSTTHREDPR